MRYKNAAQEGEWAASHLGNGSPEWYVGIKHGEDLVNGFRVPSETDASNALWAIEKAYPGVTPACEYHTYQETRA